MPRKLKAYVTSSGFFEEAIAAPSMKAAIEAWGANPNVFQRGWAKETDDPAIMAAVMAKPGVTLKRAVGSKGAFTENPSLPKSLPAKAPHAKATTRAHAAKERRGKPKKHKAGKASGEVVSLAEARARKAAAAAFEKERARREKEEAEEAAAQEREQNRRDAAARKVEAALEAAQAKHDRALATVQKKQDAVDALREREAARWNKEKSKLDAKLREAGR